MLILILFLGAGTVDLVTDISESMLASVFSGEVCKRFLRNVGYTDHVHTVSAPKNRININNESQ
jgi:hypothetical protein